MSGNGGKVTRSSKTRGVDKKDITLIKCLAKPPALVKVELSVTGLLLGHPEKQAEEWGYIKRLLANEMFLKQLQEIDTTKIPKDTAMKARDMLADVTAEKVKSVSSACYSIHEWNRKTIQAVLESADNSETK